jgi:hypothetical protein
MEELFFSASLNPHRQRLFKLLNQMLRLRPDKKCPLPMDAPDTNPFPLIPGPHLFTPFPHLGGIHATRVFEDARCFKPPAESREMAGRNR